MANPLYNQIAPQNNNNPMLKRLLDFKKTINGDPQQMVQQMLNSGKINQSQMNQLVQQTNQIYKQFRNLM